MRLFLSSYHFGKYGKEYADLVGGQRRVAVIFNASDVYKANELYAQKCQVVLDSCSQLGLEPETFDLRNYFEDQSELEADLKKFDGIWVVGGNSFVLRRAMRYSSFDQVLPKLLAEDALAYGGFSAGACVLAPSLRGIDLCDDPNDVPCGYAEEIVWEGLDIVPYAIAPHYRSEHPETELIERVVDYFKTNYINYKTLQDGQVILIAGNDAELLKQEPN